jgi:bla regulator protein blaR1
MARLIGKGAVPLVVLGLLHTIYPLNLDAQQPRFEVVSIKRSNQPPDFVRRPSTTGTFTSSATAQGLVAIAFPEITAPEDMFGLPAWATTDRYDVVAKGKAGATLSEEAEMWRQMLVERFGLKAHLESRIRPSYDLVMARNDRKLGPGLTPSTLDCSQPKALPSPTAAPAEIDRALMLRCAVTSFQGSVFAGSAEMKTLARYLRAPAGRRVVDKTGLTGRFAFRLSFEQRLGGTVVNDTFPDLFTALREQLGLKLEPSTMQVPVIVVDQIKRPSEN